MEIRRNAAIVFIMSAALFLYQLALTRIFAVTIWYHFAHLTISLSMLGLTAGALQSRAPLRLAKWLGLDSQATLAFVFPVLSLGALYVHLNVPLEFSNLSLNLLLLLCQASLFFMPFFCGGIVIARALTDEAAHFGLIYFADLVGAAMGCLLVWPAIDWFGGPGAIVFSAFLASLIPLLNLSALSMKQRALVTGISVSLLVLAAINTDQGLFEIKYIKQFYTRSLQYREIKPLVVAWTPVSRIAVFPDPDGDPLKYYGVNDGAATFGIWLYQEKDRAQINQVVLRRNGQLGNHLRPGGDTLIIGPAGGTDVIGALAAGPASIDAVEINPGIVDLMTHQLKDVVGNIFSSPRVHLTVMDGRQFVRGSRKFYDLVQVNMTDSWGGAFNGAYVFQECYLYTKEALKDYLSILKEDGILVVTRYFLRSEALRLVVEFEAAFRELGISDFDKKIVVLGDGGRGPMAFRNEYGTILVKKNGFTAQELELIETKARKNGGWIHPALSRLPMREIRQAENIRRFIAAAGDEGEREKFLDEFPQNIRPSTDDRPSFFFMSKDFTGIEDFKSGGLHPSRRFAMISLTASALLLVVVLLVCLAHFARTGRGRPAAFFTAIGLGFMFFEVSLIQRLIGYLGHPLYSTILVLATLLLSTGLGSWRSQVAKLEPGLGHRILWLGPIVILGWAVLSRHLGGELLGYPVWARMIVMVLLIGPTGFLLGHYFVAGILRLDSGRNNVASYWAINGLASVVGVSLAFILALNLGLSFCILVAAGLYLLAVSLIAAPLSC